MNKNVKFFIAGFVVAAATAWMLYRSISVRDDAASDLQSPQDAESGAGSRPDAEKRVRQGKSRSAAHAKREKRSVQKRAVASDSKMRPGIHFDVEEEAALSAEYRTLVEAIRQAMDDNNGKKVCALVRQMQSMREWPDGIPLPVRRAALEAVAWFGADALPEIAGFMGDANAEILSEAAEAYESSLLDANGDMELSSIVKAAAAAINDVETMDSILMRLNDMRPSVAVDTIKQIWATGTDAAKSALTGAVEAYTGEEGITTPDQLDAWYNDPSGDNRDDEDAEMLYGPS